MDILAWLASHIDGIDDVRDGFYVGLGIPALALLWWRSASANRQARAALEQAKAAQDQSALAQADSQTNLFQSATDMLGSEVAAVRIGAIYALQRLAKHRPEDFHVPVMQLFLAFLCNRPPIPAASRRATEAFSRPAKEMTFARSCNCSSVDLTQISNLRSNRSCACTCMEPSCRIPP